MRLTKKNYYSPQANMEYMSVSQFKSFDKCEAAALAELRGEYAPKSKTALLVGGYVDAYFSNELEEYKAEHPEMFTKDGKLKADYAKAEKAIERLERDELAMMLLKGRSQVIVTGEIAGVKYKAKIDSLLSPAQVKKISKKYPSIAKLTPFGEGMIIDLKYVKDTEDIFDEEDRERKSFIEYWGYDKQGAAYQHLHGKGFPFGIVAATKEENINIEAMYIPQDVLTEAMWHLEDRSPRYAAIKRGEIEPVGCGKCEYCRSRKKLTELKDYRMINMIEGAIDNE